tara:strand:- start:16036 stop:16956 length:921 start_codon:yes stop_codon:yes gene_type:complete
MKNFYFYVNNIFNSLIPNYFSQRKLKYLLQEVNKYPKEEIKERISYYITNNNGQLAANAIALKDFKRPKKGTMYYFDLVQYTRYFKNNLKIKFKFGDVQENQDTLTIVKSRPINHSGNSVIMKLDALRHYYFVNDVIPFSEKKNKAVWRGYIHKENRRTLVKEFYNHPKCNIGNIPLHNENPDWAKPFISIEEQLQYKFILSIEGHDVATNLKWIFSSNSLCFMPTPKFETWFMEGKLVPNVHYVHLKDDYSDLLEKMEYYTKHEEKALTIIKNAQAWVTRFQDKKLEKIISLKVLEAYFKSTKQV